MEYFSQIIYDATKTKFAAVGNKSKILYINPVTWGTLSKTERLFILFHELGHVNGIPGNTFEGEVEADRFAFNIYAERGHSLKDAVKLFTKKFNTSFGMNRERARLQLLRAIGYDAKVNKNPIL